MKEMSLDQYNNIRRQRALARTCRGIAKDALQIVDYIETDRKVYALKNLKTMIKRCERLVENVKKDL